jgi:serine/threonine protein kinase
VRAELSPRVQTVVEEALDLPAGERAAYLARYCGADAELRSAVETLVASDALANEGFLARPVLRPRPAALAELELRPAAAARWIGPYELLAKLGEGGMSSVYAARCVRGQGPDEEVAIKVVRPDLPRAAERFSREERFLQTLRHPYIARLLDTGTTTEGQPYFVMELVDGVSITSHCEVAALDVDERLVLFSRVCEAVEYAHRNLVVHRDLKPSNILVDRDGVPRLLDFGVAALLRGAGESTDPTVSVPPALTPNYAAPEQLARSQITTATDVYSLGVVLYELLTGRRPHEWAGLSEVEILRRWRVEQPPAPSRALARVASQKDEQRRGETRPRRTPRRERLARRCQGDLDNIVLKALRFEPERRYGTVGELAADLRRHLGGLPVSARSATVVYRLGSRRSRRRHRPDPRRHVAPRQEPEPGAGCGTSRRGEGPRFRAAGEAGRGLPRRDFSPPLSDRRCRSLRQPSSLPRRAPGVCGAEDRG